MRTITTAKLLSRQRGIGPQLVFNVAVILVFAFVAVKIQAAYWDNWKISKLVENLAEELPAKFHSEKDVQKRVQTQWDITDYISVIKAKDVVTLKNKKGTMYFDLVYQRKVPLVGNVTVLFDFAHHLEYAPPSK